MIRTRLLAKAGAVANRRRQPKPFASVLARTLLPRMVVFAALCAALGVGNALAVDPLAAPADHTGAPSPIWSTADALAHPGCVAATSWPEGRLADAVVVVGSGAAASGTARRIAFDRAWALNHDASRSDDVWVIGICP